MNEAQRLNAVQRQADIAHHTLRMNYLATNTHWEDGEPIGNYDRQRLIENSVAALDLMTRTRMSTNSCHCIPPCALADDGSKP